MGSTFTSTVPTFTVERARASKLQTLADFVTAATDAWGTWSPTLTNLTQGSGTVTAKYQRLGKNVVFEFIFVYGSGSAVGTVPSFTLPVAPSADYPTTSGSVFPVIAKIVDSGTTQRDAIVGWTGSVCQVLYMNAGVPASITATAPWTWASGDQIVVAGRYRTT